jgi:hypothetical protein
MKRNKYSKPNFIAINLKISKVKYFGKKRKTQKKMLLVYNKYLLSLFHNSCLMKSNLLLLLIFFCSCKGELDPDGKCGGIEKFKHTKVVILNGEDFESYQDKVHEGSATHLSLYEIKNGFAYFSLFTSLRDICTFEKVTLNVQFEPIWQLAEVIDSVIVVEEANIRVEKILPIPFNGNLFNYDESYQFKYHVENEVFTFGQCIIFPHKGSYSADSTFLFENFKKMTLESDSKIL